MGKSVYNIGEIANVHGGDFNYLKKIAEEFSSIVGIAEYRVWIYWAVGHQFFG